MERDSVQPVISRTFLVLWFVGLWSTCGGLRVDGSFASVEDWKFLARFCFMSNTGKLHYIIEYPESYKTQYLLYYFDRPHIWDAVYGTSQTCEQKKSVLDFQSGHLLPLSTVYSNANCQSETRLGEVIYRCEKTQKFSSSRDMWWFLVVSRCPSDATNPSIVGINISFSFHMTNGEEGDLLRYEFSADEFYILPIDISFLLAYLIIVTLSIICAYMLMKRQLFHSTYKLYMASLVIWTFHLLLYCIAYGRYGQYGYREEGTERAARVFATLATVIFMLMLLLMANGFTIVKGKLSTAVTIFLTVFCTIFVIGYGGLLIVEANTFDPGKILYIYEYWPGYGLIALRILGWLTFIIFLFFTLKAKNPKLRFFIPLFVFYTLWFWAGPIVVFIAMFVMDQWAREKTVHGVEQFVMFCGHLFFLILTRPNAANANFPYHIKTTQIGMIDGSEGERTNEYTLSEDQDSYTSSNVSEMFITSREKSLVKDDTTKHMNGGTESLQPQNYMQRENLRDMQEAALSAMRNPEDMEGPRNALPPLATQSTKSKGSHLGGSLLAPIKSKHNAELDNMGFHDDQSQTESQSNQQPGSQTTDSSLPALRGGALPPITNSSSGNTANSSMTENLEINSERIAQLDSMFSVKT